MASSIGPLMIDLEGLYPSPQELARIESPWVGGIILFGRNIESFEQVQTLNQTLKAHRSNLIIAIDQEGGRVQRITDRVTRLPPLGRLGTLYQQSAETALSTAAAHAELMASEMLCLGFDLSFSPVLDINHGCSEIIGDRAFGDSAEVVITLASAYIDGLDRVGLSAVGKHFPGHGGVTEDSHIALPRDPRSLVELMEQDVKPFEALSQRLQGIMTAHIIYPELCDKPATFSSRWLRNELRDRLSFSGAIFSDDLSMTGAADMGDMGQRAALALQANCDMALICNSPTLAQQAIDFLAQNHEALLEQHQSAAVQSRLQKVLQHDTLDWSEFEQSEHRASLQRQVAALVTN